MSFGPNGGDRMVQIFLIPDSEHILIGMSPKAQESVRLHTFRFPRVRFECRSTNTMC